MSEIPNSQSVDLKDNRKSAKKISSMWIRLKKLTKRKDSSSSILKISNSPVERVEETNKPINLILVDDANRSRRLSSELNNGSYVHQVRFTSLVDIKNKSSPEMCPKNCVLPDLVQITSLQFYWPETERYRAEDLLKGKADGTFLLRDSSHRNFLFSVSFRRFNRTLHARIEKDANNQFTFDSADKNCQKFNSITELFEGYKNSRCNFFDPVLETPLNNPTRHSLKQLSQFAILSSINYHHISDANLPLPSCLVRDLKCSFNFCTERKLPKVMEIVKK